MRLSTYGKPGLFSIDEAVFLTCRCWLYIEREVLFGLVPGAAIRCRDHGLQTLLSTTPRPWPWEVEFARKLRRARTALTEGGDGT